MWSLHDRLSARGLGRGFTDALSALLTAKPSQTGGETAIAIRGAAYRLALEDLPEWSVVEACRRSIRDPGKWAPNPGELRALALEVMNPERLEAGRIAKILSAKPRRDRTPEERARVQGLVRGLADSLRRASSAA